MIKYSSLLKIADGQLLISIKSPNLLHSLFWNWAIVDVLHLWYVWPIQPPNIYEAESVDAVPYDEILNKHD